MRISVAKPHGHLLVVGVCLWFGGCGGEATQSIPTYPVNGTVLLADGRPLSGGMIEFRSLDNTTLTTTSVIAPDGTFALKTLLDGGRVDGAVAGEYRVTVTPTPPETDDVQAVGTVISLPDSYQISAAGDNAITITLPAS
ncbi:MAG: hypothetical protein R3C10_01835 [Pirellulales bacterium]